MYIKPEVQKKCDLTWKMQHPLPHMQHLGIVVSPWEVKDWPVFLPLSGIFQLSKKTKKPLFLIQQVQPGHLCCADLLTPCHPSMTSSEQLSIFNVWNWQASFLLWPNHNVLTFQTYEMSFFFSKTIAWNAVLSLCFFLLLTLYTCWLNVNVQTSLILFIGSFFLFFFVLFQKVHGILFL